MARSRWRLSARVVAVLLLLGVMGLSSSARAVELDGFGEEDDEDGGAPGGSAAAAAAATAARRRKEAAARAARGGVSRPDPPPEAGGAAAGGGAVAERGGGPGDGKLAKSGEKVLVMGGKRRADEDWDTDEFENVPAEGYKPHQTPISQLERRPAKRRDRPDFNKDPRTLYDYKYEFGGLFLLAAYFAYYVFGRRQNTAIATAFANEFGSRGSVLHNNFSLIGPVPDSVDEPPSGPTLMKESQSEFKMYCTGRRFCESMMITLVLKKRHDVLQTLLAMLSPVEDIVRLEVVMNPGEMENICFAIAPTKIAKAMHKADESLGKNTSAMDLLPEKKRQFVHDELMVFSESFEVANDLVTDHALELAFGKQGWVLAKPYFRSMYVSNTADKQGRKLIRFEFLLPDGSEQKRLGRLLLLAMHYIDVFGRYRLSATAAQKIKAVRNTLNKEKAKQELEERKEERKEELQKIKEEKRFAELEARKDLSREARKKLEEKEARREKKKQAKGGILIRKG